jgi:hypothetical protein
VWVPSYWIYSQPEELSQTNTLAYFDADSLTQKKTGLWQRHLDKQDNPTPPLCLTSWSFGPEKKCDTASKIRSNHYLSTNLVTETVCIIDIESLQNRLLKVCCVPTTSASLQRLLFCCCGHVLMKQTRQAVCAIKQSILLRCLWYVWTFCQIWQWIYTITLADWLTEWGTLRVRVYWIFVRTPSSLVREGGEKEREKEGGGEREKNM